VVIMDPTMRLKWTSLDFGPADGKELFQLLDDGDGEIETNEFFEGLMKMKGIAQARDVFRMERSLARLQLSIDDHFERGTG